jgi:hypothetical protein
MRTPFWVADFLGFSFNLISFNLIKSEFSRLTPESSGVGPE